MIVLYLFNNNLLLNGTSNCLRFLPFGVILHTNAAGRWPHQINRRGGLEGYVVDVAISGTRGEGPQWPRGLDLQCCMGTQTGESAILRTGALSSNIVVRNIA